METRNAQEHEGLKVLVIGSGGREHALCWKIAQSPLVDKIYCLPGNPGTAMIAVNVSLKAETPKDMEAIFDFAFRNRIDLTVVGPELPLTLGIVDLFEEAGLKIFGPSARAALIEGSKAFSKELMARYKIPTAAYRVFGEGELSGDVELARAVDFINGFPKGDLIVVKADGLAAGKGVIIAQTKTEAIAAVAAMLSGDSFGQAGKRVVVEEFLEGEEASFLAFTDGKTIIPLASAQDHKAVHDGDQGPNTGGMGAYSPAPVVSQFIEKKTLDNVMHRAVNGMAGENRIYRGVLYAGLMIDGDSVKVLEFNARFGDPEIQVILMRMKSDIVPFLLAVANHDLSSLSEIEWHPDPAVCVVLAAEGYPEKPRKGDGINFIDGESNCQKAVYFHAGTVKQNGELVTSGGRVIGATALGLDLGHAIERAYALVNHVEFYGKHYRHDIGAKALGR